jgi:hypothetical protein
MKSSEHFIEGASLRPWKFTQRSCGNERRDREMSYTLTEAEPDEELEKVTGDIPSIIAPEEPFDPDPVPETDPAPKQPEEPTPPAHPNIPPRTSILGADPVAQTELPRHISPIH